MKMRHLTMINAVVVLLSVSLICGCVPQSRKGRFGDHLISSAKWKGIRNPEWHAKVVELNVAGRHKEIVEFCESQPDLMERSSNKTLPRVCNAYFELKRFDSLFDCLDCVEKKYANGDRYAIDSPPRGPKYGYTASSGFRYDASSWACHLRAEAYLQLGQFANAVDSFKKSIDLYRNGAYPGQVSTHGYVVAEAPLVLAYAFNNEKEKALALWERVLPAMDKDHARIISKNPTAFKLIPMDENGRICSHITIIAKTYMALKDYEEVCSTIKVEYLKSLRDFWSRAAGRGTGIGGVFQIMPLEFMLNKARFETGRTALALEGYKRLLEMPQISYFATYYQTIMHDMGRISLDNGEVDQAIDCFARSIDTIEQQRSTINTEVSKIGFVGDKQAVYHEMVGALIATERYEEAFSYAERGKARALVDMLASKKSFSGGQRENAPQVAGLIGEWQKTEQKVIEQVASKKAKPSPGLRGFMIQKRKEFIQADPEIASLMTVSTADTAKLRELLPPDEALIEYFGSGEKFFVFCVTRNGIHGVKLDTEGLERDVRAFRGQISSPASNLRGIVKKPGKCSADNLNKKAEALYKRLFQPIEAIIHKVNITIVPHGVLHYLPFNALCSKKGYLIDRYSIRMLPSASVMVFLKPGTQARAGGLIVFGNPDLKDSRYDLPFAEAEALAIAKERPDSKVLIRGQASETSLKKLCGQFKYVHLATHGNFNPDTPMASGLLLSRDSANDGMLTVGEIYDLSLNADLVTLSACDTALGKVANGDDVIGLTRGFLYAGANSIVSSLWKVDDKATSMLMQEFYRSLKYGDKRNALRKAQLKVKNDYLSHPFFWAAFQITGAVK